MGFFDTIGKVAGAAAGAAANGVCNLADKIQTYRDEMEDYDYDELRAVMENSMANNIKRGVAETLIREKYGR